MEEKSTKILILTIVAVVTLIVLVVGATYAYFIVGATNNFETRTIEASADSVGVVTLTSSEDNLHLNMPAHLMMKDAIPEGKSEIQYYAVTDPDGLPSTSEPNYIAATFTLTGEGTYECSGNYDVTISGTMFENAKTLYNTSRVSNIIIHIVKDTGGLEFWYNMSSDDCFNGNCSGEFNFNIGGDYGNTDDIYMNLYFINKKEIDQSVLAGTSMTANFDITDFSCTAISEE